MFFNTLHFLNKNLYRKYPFASGALMSSNLPLSLVTSCNISTVYGKHSVYLRQLVKKGNKLSFEFREDATQETLCAVNVILDEDFKFAQLEPLQDFVSGNLQMGSMESLSSISDGVYHFTFAETALEASCVFVFNRPQLQKVTSKENVLFGELEFTGRVNFNVNDLTFSVPQPQTLGATGSLCNFEFIQKLNTVTPDINNNIDIYGIDPVTVSVGTGKLLITVTDLSLEEYCGSDKQNIAQPIS